MFERFTAKARHVVVLSQEEARTLGHNYIGTEHILLGLIKECEAVSSPPACLSTSLLTLDGIREEVTAVVGAGKKTQSGHIPFTPRAKKVLVPRAARGAATQPQLHRHRAHLAGRHPGGDGVAAQILRKHADLLKVRTAVLDMLPAASTLDAAQRRRWLRRRSVVLSERERPGGPGGLTDTGEQGAEAGLTATPAADATLSTAARLAACEPVGSHHLLLAALTDANSAAARVLASLGIDLNQAKDALRDADVAYTSDEQPGGRRQAPDGHPGH